MAACGGGSDTPPPRLERPPPLQLRHLQGLRRHRWPHPQRQPRRPLRRQPRRRPSPHSGIITSLGTTEPAKNKGGQLVEGTFADAKTCCPILSTDTSSNRVIDLMFNSVMTVDPSDVSPKGKLAEKFDISSDGITYTFNLRSGVKWHDGQPFSAQDVKFTYDLAMNPKTGSPRTSELTERVDSIEAPDDSTIVVKLKAPNAAFMVSNAVYNIIPQHVLKDVDPAALAQDEFSTGKKGRTIGTGPFQFEEWVKDDHMTLVKYDGYWQGSPNLDKYIYKVVPDQNVLVQQLKTGEIDVGTIQESSVDEDEQARRSQGRAITTPSASPSTPTSSTRPRRRSSRMPRCARRSSMRSTARR